MVWSDIFVFDTGVKFCGAGGASDDAKCSEHTYIVCSSKQQSTAMERQHMQKICKACPLSMRALMATAYCGEVAGSTGGVGSGAGGLRAWRRTWRGASSLSRSPEPCKPAHR